MKYVICLITLVFTNVAYAKDFDVKHSKVIQSIVWAADVSNVPRELVLAICYGESNFRTAGVTHIDGPTLSHSICQVKLETAQFLDKLYRHKTPATPDRLEDIKVNAFYAAKLLKYQLNRYEDNWKLAVDAYNKGTAVSEKSKYVQHIIEALHTIRDEIDDEIIYGKHQALR